MSSVTRLRPRTVEGQPEPRPRGQRVSDRWYRRRRVHVVLGLVVAVLTALWAGQRAADGVRTNLDARLRDAGAGADASLVVLESEQLAALRAATFTSGVGRALASRDVRTLNRLVTPVQANSNVPMMDVVLPDGRVALAVRSRGAPAPVASRAGLAALDQALREAHGDRGGRLTEVVLFRSGPTLMTIGPVVYRGKPVGAVLAMTPLADALGRFSQQVGVTLTAYDADGYPIATTAGFRPRRIDASEAQALIGGGPIETRYVVPGQREELGRLIVDHEPDAILGTALHDNSWVTGRWVMIYAALGLLATIVIVGTFALRFGPSAR